MPKKKRAGLKKKSAKEEVLTSDDQAVLPKRSVRPRNKAEAKVVIEKISSKYLDLKANGSEVQSDSENAYDADSELDQNPATESETDYEEQRMVSNDVAMEDKGISMHYPDVASFGNKIPFVKLDKENITPPGSHSTPNVVQRAVRNLDESLFGFNDLESPLQLSPVRGVIRDAISPTSSSKCSTTSVTPGKRKLPRDDGNLVPIENPKKRSKRKPKKEPLPESDLWRK